MKKYVVLFLCFLLFATGCGNTKTTTTPEDKSAYEVTDYQGTKIKLAHKPQRIITDSFGLDEIVLELVPAEKLVAVNYLDKDPAISFIAEETKNIKTTLKNYGIEEIVSLHPDLFIASTWTDAGKIQALRRLNIPVVVCRGPISVKEVKANVSLVAAALGEKSRGKNINEQVDVELAKIAAVLKNQHKPKPVVLLVSLMSSYGGTGSLYDALCQQAGLINGIAKVGIKNGEFLAKELVVQANPDLFILSAPSQSDEKQYAQYKKQFMSDPALQSLPGIKNVAVLPDRYIYCSSQNIVYGIKVLTNKGYDQELLPVQQEPCIKGY